MQHISRTSIACISQADTSKRSRLSYVAGLAQRSLEPRCRTSIPKVVALVLVLALATAFIANAQDNQPESSAGLVSVLEARSQVRFPIDKCKNDQGQPANGQYPVKPGSCSGRSTFACCGYGGSTCSLAVPGRDFKGTGCKYLWFGACCEF